MRMTAEQPPEESSETNELEEMTLYTVAQVAKVFGVSNYTVRVWLNAEKGLRGVKVGSGNRGCWRVTKQEMVRFANDKFGGDLPNE